jgi:hypothetical protein
MRTLLRVLLCLAISSSIATAVMPARTAVAQPAKTSCCAKAKKDALAKDCEHQAPKSEQDKQCCVACPLCVALFLTRATPFVYPTSGEESFATVFERAQALSYRPPVPPPRA